MEQGKTTYPKKPTGTETEKKEALNDLATDFDFNELPEDWKNLINASHDPDLNRWLTKFQKRTLYIYQINRLYKNDDNTIKFSANSIKIGFINQEKAIVTDAWEVDAFNSQLNSRNNNNVSDNQTIFELTDQKTLIFQNNKLDHDNKIYAVSINQSVTEENLNELYIINSYVEPWKNPKLRNTKSIVITKIRDWKANNGYPLIIKIHKQLDANTKITGIKIKYPKPMLFGNIKINGLINGINCYPKTLLTDDYINFPLLSMPIETDPKVRVLQWWFSEQILPWSLAKQFLSEKSVLDLIKIEEGTETRNEVIKNARITSAWLATAPRQGNFPLPGWPRPKNQVPEANYPNDRPDGQFLINDKKFFSVSAYEEDIGEGNKIFWRQLITTVDTYSDVAIEIKDTPSIDSLQKVLLNMLSYTYNYYRNFEESKYDSSGNPINEMAKLRQKFDGQKPENVITNLWKQWELDNPNYVNVAQVKNFKKIVIMLSKYIFAKLAINTGLNDDNKILLPYYFELISKPLFNAEDKRKDWEFKDCKVVLRSEYFDLTDLNNIKMKTNDLSQNKLYQLDENQFNWLAVTNELESNAIPSLLPQDWKLSDGEFHKYFTNLIIKKDKLEESFNLYGKLQSNLYSKFELFNLINQIATEEFEIKTEIPLNAINEIELSGIFGYGNYDLTLITSKENQEIEIKNINLFSENEKISLIKIEI